jgi:hypothetical protein
MCKIYATCPPVSFHVPLVRKLCKTHEAVLKNTLYVDDIFSGLVVVGATVRFDTSTSVIVGIYKIVYRVTPITV